MADSGQPKLNEFYLLHTHPTKVFRRVKGVDIEVIHVGADSEAVVHCEVKKGEISCLLQKSYPAEAMAEEVAFDLRQRTEVRRKPWQLCPQCGGHTEATHVLRRADFFFCFEDCRCSLGDVAVRKDLEVLRKLSPKPRSKWILKQSRDKVAYLTHHRIAYCYWSDLKRGEFATHVVNFEDRSLEKSSHIADFVIERPGFSILWDDGRVLLPRMKEVGSVAGHDVEEWDCMVKVDKNRYAVSGLNQTTDPYTQVIKLVDSRLRPISKVEFKLRGHPIRQRSPMFMIGKQVLVVIPNKGHLHVLRVDKKGMEMLKAGVELCGEDPVEATYLAPLDLKRAVAGLANGHIAIIKLTFH